MTVRRGKRARPPAQVRPQRARPTREEVAAATDRRLPDILAADLDLLLCGINPGLYSAAIGHHFGRPGNRFWPVLHAAGITPVRLEPHEDHRLTEWGVGLTNVASRATARADELTRDELHRGAATLRRKVARYRPRWLAFVGIGVYRSAFDQKAPEVGPKPESIAGARVWVLPNTSGLNAHYSTARLTELFAELRAAVWAGHSAEKTP